jgi:hypothetical protein
MFKQLINPSFAEAGPEQTIDLLESKADARGLMMSMESGIDMRTQLEKAQA